MVNQFNFSPNYQTANSIYTTLEQAKYLLDNGQMPLDIYQAIVVKANTELRILEIQNRR